MARRRPRHIPPVEWITATISAAIVVGSIGFLVFEAVQPASEEPRLAAAVLEVRERDGSFVVEFEVRNSGRGAAAGVHVAGVARAADGGERQGLAVVDYVPGFSARRASLMFDVDPGPQARVRIIGYARP
jgi:uncharacterized protein (TIGR02588 family)